MGIRGCGKDTPTVGIVGVKEKGPVIPVLPDLWKAFPYSCPGKVCAIGLSHPGTEGHGKDYFSLGGGRFSKEGSGLLGSAPPGAQALECYSCVQKADDGCSPHKMKTVKCAPGVDVCTEAVGAVETSEWGPPGHAHQWRILRPSPASL